MDRTTLTDHTRREIARVESATAKALDELVALVGDQPYANAVADRITELARTQQLAARMDVYAASCRLCSGPQSAHWTACFGTGSAWPDHVLLLELLRRQPPAEPAGCEGAEEPAV